MHHAEHTGSEFELEEATQLFDAVDLTSAFDLDRYVGSSGIPAQQVDWADRGRMLTSDERQTGCQRLRVLREQRLQMCLDAILLQPWVDSELIGGIVEHIRQPDLELVTVPSPDFPEG